MPNNTNYMVNKMVKRIKFFIAFLFFFNLIFSLYFNTFSIADDLFDQDSILENYNIENILQAVSDTSNEPVINSRAAILYERNTGRILWGKNENEKKKMASTTKILTALIVLEQANLDDTIVVSSNAAATGGSRVGLSTGDKITVKDLLYGLMLCSGNDAAVALAEYVGRKCRRFC